MTSWTFCRRAAAKPHGYNEFIASVDAIVIGRKTFEKVLTFGVGRTQEARRWSEPAALLICPWVRGGVAEQMAGAPAEIVSQLAARGVHNLYIDGGITIQRFLRAGGHSTTHYQRGARAYWEGVPLFGALRATFGSVT